MHEDDSVSDIAANVQLCTISQHFLLNRSEIRRLLPDVRVVQFETPMRQRDPKVHALSNAVRHAKAETMHIQQMRDNPYDPRTSEVDIILCALRKDAAKINLFSFLVFLVASSMCEWSSLRRQCVKEIQRFMLYQMPFGMRKLKRLHIRQMRDNPYDPRTSEVDIILRALRKDAAKINLFNLKTS